MKNIHKIFLLSGLLLFSCSDFLEENPRNQISLNQFFSQANHAENAVNSLYRTGVPNMLIGGGAYSGTRIMLGQYMSGFFDNEYKGQEPHIQNVQQLTIDGLNTDDYLNGMWSNLYLGISRANNAIKYIPDTPGLAEQDKNRLLAEAKFFRAYAYYLLVQWFGEVPLIEEPYESLENLFIARSSIKSIYDLITSDLEFAVNQGGLADVPMVNNGYRITKGAAATLLAEAYLTMSGFPLRENRYADAARVARSVINSGIYNLTTHDRNGNGEVIPENSAYNKIRKEQALANEYIYQLEFFVGITENNYPQWSYPVALASEVRYAITNGAYQPVPSFLWGYNADEDLRVQEKQFFHTTFTRPNGQVLTFEPTPYRWHDDVALFQTSTSGKDLLAYSYADVLLIAAEAIAQSEGVTPEAIGYLADIKERAYWKQSRADIIASMSGMSATAFTEEVWRERYRELVFEFKLWFDMLRTRKFPQTTQNGNGSIQFIELVGATSAWGRQFQERHLRLPLPLRELQRNPSLTQNEGYN